MQLGYFLRTPLHRAIVGFAVATVTLMVLMLGRPFFTNASKPQLPLPSVLAIQFPRDVEDIDAILSDAPSPDREALRIKLYIDYFLIPSYVGLLAALALRLREPRPSGSGLPAVAILTAIATGIFDVIENRATHTVLNTPLSATTQIMADNIRRAALAKWSLLAICAALLLIEWTRRRAKPTS